MAVAPWLVELARTTPGLLRSYLPGSPVDGRTRERVMAIVTDVDRGWAGWVHQAWADYLGERLEEPDDAEEALLAFAEACAAAGRPVDATALALELPPDEVAVARATVAHVGAAAVVGRRADRLLDRARRRRPLAPMAAATEAATVAMFLPVAAPFVVAAAAKRATLRLAPPMPAVEAEDDSNLLVHLLSRTVPVYLANAGVRLAALRLPLPLTFAIRTGRSAATVRIGRGRVVVREGVSPDALFVLEGDVEPLLQVATGSLVRELAGLRVKRE